VYKARTFKLTDTFHGTRPQNKLSYSCVKFRIFDIFKAANHRHKHWLCVYSVCPVDEDIVGMEPEKRLRLRVTSCSQSCLRSAWLCLCSHE